jgi:hypothetical protein
MSRALIWGAALLVLIKIILAVVFPVFGDEAYYIFWGTHPAGGYYDLPPMVGWWLALLSQISLNPLWLRTFNLLTAFLVALGLYEISLPLIGKSRALMAGALFLFLPLPFLTVISFPDVPLLLFGFLSSLLFFKGVQNSKLRFSPEVFLSGSLWGAAFLSKYFAVFLIPAFVIWFALVQERRLRDVCLFALGAIPFVFQHLWWNRTHCWANFVFNLITRQKVYEGSVFQTFGFFLGHLVLVGGPILLSMTQFRKTTFTTDSGYESISLKRLRTFFLLLWLVPILIFAMTALLGRGQGLHWLLFLTPYFVGWSVLYFSEARIRMAAYFSGASSGMIAFLLIVAFLFPDSVLSHFFKGQRAFEFQLLNHPNAFVVELKPELEGVSEVFLGGYTLAAEFDDVFRRFDQKIPVSVWAEGSRFGRVFDWTTDFSNLEGKRIAVLTAGPFFPEERQHYFSSLRTLKKEFRGAAYTLAIGESFQAKKYQKEVIRPAIEKYYPEFWGGACPLKEDSNAH